MLVRASELAACLGVSAARISQYVAAGKLEGCFHGEGRARRFDLDACAQALGQRLDVGQMHGNGDRTRRILDRINRGPAKTAALSDAPSPDASRFELAKTEKMEQEARRLKRDNELAAGTLVLASEVEREVGRMMNNEIAKFELVLRDGARRVADQMGVDFKAVRAVLMTAWRDHRTERAKDLQAAAEIVTMSEIERRADI